MECSEWHLEHDDDGLFINKEYRAYRMRMIDRTLCVYLHTNLQLFIDDGLIYSLAIFRLLTQQFHGMRVCVCANIVVWLLFGEMFGT